MTDKAWYQHKSKPLRMKVISVSFLHPDYLHVGLQHVDEILVHCHIHSKDIDDDWIISPDPPKT